jgi:hypothetical protein
LAPAKIGEEAAAITELSRSFVNEKVRATFATALRALLRQDRKHCESRVGTAGSTKDSQRCRTETLISREYRLILGEFLSDISTVW